MIWKKNYGSKNVNTQKVKRKEQNKIYKINRNNIKLTLKKCSYNQSNN